MILVEDSVDVLIVGAGPAGLSTAYHLNDSGLEVIVFESSYNPRSKPCAGLLQAEAFDEFPILRSVPKVAVEDVIVTYNDIEYHVEFEEPIAYVIDRTSAGWTLAGRMDAELELGGSVVDVKRIEEGRIVRVLRPDGETEEYKTRYLVGSDGALSIVRRKAGFHDRVNEYTIGSAYQAIVSGFYKPRLLLGRWAPKGYARVYPSPTGETRIGLGTLKAYSKGYRDKLFELLALYDIETYTPQFGYVPLVGRIKESVKNGAFLVGDAAGHVQPLNGMGIYYAMKAGKYAAEAIKKEDEMEYEKLRKSSFGYDLHLGRKALEKGIKSKVKKRFTKRLAKITAELLMGRVTKMNLIKARLIMKLGV